MTKKIKDHITPLGFKNDGYDYSQHLKEMGGGNFIGRDGSVRALPPSKIVDLPPDALPSEAEFDRRLEAITISNEFMDEDLEKALFEAEEGDFEELLDDFVETAMAEPETPDFDYDAHIAALIARSEGQMMGGVAPRGWSDDEDDEVSSYDGASDYAGSTTDKKVRHGKLPEEYMRTVEEQFEKTLEEYNDENIGDLEDEAEDEHMQGNIDLDGDNELLVAALDEFLLEAEDEKLATGVSSYKKGSRAIGEDPSATSDDADQIDEAELVKRVQEFTIESTEAVEEDGSDADKDIEELMTCQEYLREERVEEQWDCETILSTYSTLDNHPARIQKEVSNKKKKKRSKKADGTDDASSVMSGTSYAASSNHSYAYQSAAFFSKGSLRTPTQTQKIVLGGKYMLPKEKKDKPKAKTKLEPVQDIGEDSSEEEGSNSDVSGDEEEDQTSRRKREKPKPLRKVETAEEKKLRKAKVKEERREKRANKKQLKAAFKSEEFRQGQITGQHQDIDHVSVFRY
eukprot:CAMPEP_0185035276 /NCGR_PEP_ID=MMETSP1103-20130426/26359_1 /TAXON_ID=36769 /ORGANISM="Paraphysomonas bandaiensis, Strain Caron Lab Isolate" /LENGTH=513 /DNA_ID=CAMNT_0027572283 /DNA_START=227 /DNA_END=1768 /DNA_ORIENTATION=+